MFTKERFLFDRASNPEVNIGTTAIFPYKDKRGNLKKNNS